MGNEPVLFGTLITGHAFTSSTGLYIKARPFPAKSQRQVNALRVHTGELVFFEYEESVRPAKLRDVTGRDCDKYGRCTAT